MGFNVVWINIFSIDLTEINDLSVILSCSAQVKSMNVSGYEAPLTWETEVAIMSK